MMTVRDFVNEAAGQDNLHLRSRLLTRLSRVGLNADDEVKKSQVPTVKEIIARVVGTTDAPIPKTADTTIIMPQSLGERCPVCRGALTQGILHTGTATGYCPKCRVAKTPGRV